MNSRRTLCLLAASALAAGCGGGVWIPPPPIMVGTTTVRFGTVEEFYALPGVAEMLARSGITPVAGQSPPPLVGEYAVQGALVLDDWVPEEQGAAVEQNLRFFDPNQARIGCAIDGAIGAFTNGPASTSSAIVTGSGDAFTVHFHLVTFQNREVFGADLGCYESRVGVVHGTRLPDGSLEITVASTTTGLDGRWVSQLEWDGVTRQQMVGSLRILRLVATPAP